MARARPEAAASTPDRLELLVERRDGAIALLSPGVGLFTGARERGDLLAAGAQAGALLVLGRARTLVVPDGIEGRVVNVPPALTRQPVAWGDPLYELRLGAAANVELDDDAPADPAGTAAGHSSQLVFRSPRSGRFYLRPSPSEDAFVTLGGLVEDGQPVGLIEVMKTFAHVRYTAAGGLPPRARVTRVLVADGAEVAAGEPLLELEPASS